MKRPKTEYEIRWHARVAECGCMLCQSPAEVHHIRAGNGMGQNKHLFVIPLCPRHHKQEYKTGFHAMPRQWQKEHGTEEELLERLENAIREEDGVRTWSHLHREGE